MDIWIRKTKRNSNFNNSGSIREETGKQRMRYRVEESMLG